MPQTAMTPPDLPLRDIHLPTPVSWWPPAPGWWLLSGLVLILVLLLWLLLRYRRRRRLRRLALRQLTELARLADTELAAPLSRLLRQAALSHFPPRETAGLQGQAWLEFLDRPFKDQPFSKGVGRCLADAPYRPPTQVETGALLSLCQAWLKKLPPQARSFRGSR
jgi:hypothetical protein